jgi:hypothetical protein
VIHTKGLSINRPTVKIALALVATECSDSVSLFEGLNTFGNDLKSETFSHRCYCSYDRNAVRL